VVERFSPPHSTWPNSIKSHPARSGPPAFGDADESLAANVSRLYGLDMAALPAGDVQAAQARKRPA